MRPPPSLRPLVLTGVAAAISLTLLLVGAAQGWLGPDVDQGGHFCEAERDCLLRQPMNSLSNLGFVVVGLLIAWPARRPEGGIGRPHAATAMALVVTLLGPASMAMHATETELGGRLDLLSMYLIASFTTAWAVLRVTGCRGRTAVALFVVLVIACEVIENVFGAVPLVDHAANAAFAALLITTVVLETLLIPRMERRNGWGVAAVVAMLVAFAVWVPSHDGGPLCDPHSLLQGHAVWHLLCAVAAYCLYRLYASERPRVAT